MHLNSSAPTPAPPYYAVIFTSNKTQIDEGYGEMADKMFDLASAQPGYLGAESFRNEDGFGVTISYWQTLEDIKKWKQHWEHREAQQKGRAMWYTHYKLRICRVERDYEFNADSQ